jgi:putative acetyltransferase
MSVSSEALIVPAYPEDFDAITATWEASVRATHHFLKEEDILYYKPLIRNEYLYVVNLFCTKNTAGQVEGFLGTLHDKIEMLFIDPRLRGRGTGKALLRYAIDEMGCRKVDVNEQNEQAVGFYLHMGFSITGRSELDGSGKPYPILHLALQQPSVVL